MIGTNKFRRIIELNKDEIWQSLACQSKDVGSKPLRDVEMFKSLHGDLEKYNSGKLRQLISWAVQKAAGELIN